MCYIYFMEEILKYTYLLDAKQLDKVLTKMWERYQHILENPTWEDLNEARAILYVIGYLFPEEIAPEAIKRRLHLLSEPLEELDFYQIVDSDNQAGLAKRKTDTLFLKMVEFYKVVKAFKNKTNKGIWYLDEDRFVDIYNKYSPDRSMKIGRFGEFDKDDK